MTDDEAKQQAEMLLKATRPGGTMDNFLRHALRAIEDRAALLSVVGIMSLNDAVTAARRHMRGEP